MAVVDQMLVPAINSTGLFDFADGYLVLQTITSTNKLLSGVASYPAEGGYV